MKKEKVTILGYIIRPCPDCKKKTELIHFENNKEKGFRCRDCLYKDYEIKKKVTFIRDSTGEKI